MLRGVLYIFVFVFCPGIASATVAVVRGGEHGDFTRLAISATDPFAETTFRNLEGLSFAIGPMPSLTDLDSAEMFTRLNAGRVESISFEGKWINLKLKCDCSIEVSALAVNFLIVDIYDVTTIDTGKAIQQKTDRNGEIFISKDGVPNSGSLDADTFLQLDMTVVDRVSRRIVEQIETFGGDYQSMLSIRPRLNADTGSDYAASKNTTSKQEVLQSSECEIYRQVWNGIKSNSGSPNRSEQDQETHASKGEANIIVDTSPQNGIVSLIASGLLHEAIALVDEADPESSKYQRLTDVLIGKHKQTIGRGRIAIERCNEFADLVSLIESGLSGEDLANSQIMRLFHIFELLPIGLQLAVFDSMEPILSRVSSAPLQGYYEQRNAEQALSRSIERMEMSGSGSQVPMADPDALAAIAIELKGTELEEASGLASFAAYLSERRYFDALKSMTKLESLSDQKRQDLISKLMLDLSERGDTVTFLSIVFDHIAADPSELRVPSVEVMMIRLLDEGFPEKSIELFLSHSGYQRDDGLWIHAARAYIAEEKPQKALEILTQLSGPDVAELRANALARLKDHAAAYKIQPDSHSSHNKELWAWLAGDFEALSGSESQFAPVAELLATGDQAAEADVTVLSASEDLATAKSIRTHLGQLVQLRGPER